MSHSIAFAAFLSCAVTSSFCYIKIYYTLRLSQAQVQDQDHQGQPNQEGIQVNRVRYKRTVSTALWVQVLFLACHLPFGLLLGFITITGLNTHHSVERLDPTESNTTVIHHLYPCHWKK